MFGNRNQSLNNFSMHSQLDEHSEKSERVNRRQNGYPNLEEFSFKLNYNSKPTDKSFNQCESQANTLTLRQNLIHLEKEQIIQILLQQIKINKFNHQTSFARNKQEKLTVISQRPVFEETFSAVSKGVRNSYRDLNNKNLQKQKYEELVKDFQEYINNTTQAQNHYKRAINDLKKQVQKLKQELINNKSSVYPSKQSFSSTQQLIKIQKNSLIAKLQQTVQNYLKINNELIIKVDKVQRLKRQQFEINLQLKEQIQSLIDQIEISHKQNQKFARQNDRLCKQNSSFKSIIDQLKQYIQQRRQVKQADIPDYQKYDQNYYQKYDSNKERLDCYDSIINASQIKKREQICNSPSIIFSQKNHYQQEENQNQKMHEQIQSQFLYEQPQQNGNSQCFRRISKQIKTTDFKLEELQYQKELKIKEFLQEIKCQEKQINGQQKHKPSIKQELLNFRLNSKNNFNLEENYKFQASNQDIIKQSHLIKDLSNSHFIGGSRTLNSSHNSLKNSKSQSSIAYTQDKSLKQTNKIEEYYMAKSLFSSNKKTESYLKQNSEEPIQTKPSNLELENKNIYCGMRKKPTSFENAKTCLQTSISQKLAALKLKKSQIQTHPDHSNKQNNY